MAYFKFKAILTCACLIFIFTGCNGTSGASVQPAPLSANKINLIFVTSPDLKYNISGDIRQDTANLTPQGLNRSLALGSYLKSSVLGGNNTTAIYALQPVSHMQNGYPDMASIEFIQQFAMLNQTSIGGVSANSFPIYTSYASTIVPSIVPSSANPSFCSNCTGLNFDNSGNNNLALISNILNSKTAGYYVFSAPWETISSLMSALNAQYGYNLNAPESFNGSNFVYAVSINSSGGQANLTTYNSNIVPSSDYPAIGVSVDNPCQATKFSVAASGAISSGTINKNQTVYFIRHAEAHPNAGWDDGNNIAAGQWRSLAMPMALQNKLNPVPSMVYSVDPSQVIGNGVLSYVRPSLTAQPYAIANNLPYYLAYSVFWGNVSDVINYLFFNGTFSNKTMLVAWEHDTIAKIINTLSGYAYNNASYPYSTNTAYYNTRTNTEAIWHGTDYDSIWTVTLDAGGNLSVNNATCQGINSALLPNYAPQF